MLGNTSYEGSIATLTYDANDADGTEAGNAALETAHSNDPGHYLLKLIMELSWYCWE